MPLTDEQPRLDDRQFDLAVRRLADALRYGEDASPYLGSGVDYAQSRPYVPGDPVKSIDWRVTARVGRPFVKQYEAPKQLPTWLVVDDTPSMWPASGPSWRNPGKWAWATLLAGALGLAALRRTSPVGLITTADTASPSLSRARLHQHVNDLRRRRNPAARSPSDRAQRDGLLGNGRGRPPVDGSQALRSTGLHRNDGSPNGASNARSLGHALRDAGEAFEERANVIVLSDWHDPHLLDVARTVAERHDVVALRLRDPSEDRPIDAGVVGVLRAREAETGEAFIATGHSRFRPEIDVNTELSRAAIDHIDLRTDVGFVPVLREFLRNRAASGRRRG